MNLRVRVDVKQREAMEEVEEGRTSKIHLQPVTCEVLALFLLS